MRRALYHHRKAVFAMDIHICTHANAKLLWSVRQTNDALAHDLQDVTERAFNM
jgi:hypothetical protein